MPTDRQLEQTISRWLEGEAPMQLPDRVLRATFERTRKTKQQASWQALLRRLQVNRIFAALAGVAAVVVIALVAVGLYFNQPPGIGGGPATPTQAPSPTAQPTPEPSLTATPEPTSTRDTGLPVGPFDFEDQGMGMSVTIPASGWAFDPPFTLFEKGTERANMPEAGILFWSYPDVAGFDVYGDPCQWASTIPDMPATTVDELAAALAAQPSRDASDPIDVMVDGYAGKSITLHVPHDAVFDDCDEGNFASYGVAGDSEPSRYHQGPGQIDALWILDVGGTIVIIDAMYRADTPADLIEEMRGIVESTTFEGP